MQRILEEYNSFFLNPDPSFEVRIANNNYYLWNCVLKGPPGSLYEGGRFRFTLNIPSNYPNTPPSIIFQNKPFHCDIRENGYVCWELQAKWSPSWRIRGIFGCLIGLLFNPVPHPGDRYEPDLLYCTNRPRYEQRAREITNLNRS
ncbi:unnamed protein product [Blepharisma stoltei]|uniref:UBC core domain-containing protein n=1 Tax=Blepharisma stoltei TaxID=1481888 RepID=A0AAU9IME3_9CILI|nr:unnamed protein product [Blepharisma stoltei]